MRKKAIYPGSFDPFTNGHLDIVKKAAALFDEVYIVIGVNSQKKRSFDCKGMQAAIEQTVREQGLTNCRVCVCEGLIAAFAKELGTQYMIRGLRNNLDYNYEENIAEVNKLINPDMEYIYFRAENVAVSSSMVNELHSFGQDISKYVPMAVLKLMREKQ